MYMYVCWCVYVSVCTGYYYLKDEAEMTTVFKRSLKTDAVSLVARVILCQLFKDFELLETSLVHRFIRANNFDGNLSDESERLEH